MTAPKINRTPQESTPQTLQESEQLFRSFVRQNIDGIALIDPQGTVVEWNASIEKIFGLMSKEIIGLKAWEMQFRINHEENTTPEHRRQVEEAYREILRTGIVPEQMRSREEYATKADGARIFAEQKVFTIKTIKGYWLGVIIRDLTERKQTEENLRTNEQRYRALYERTNDAVFMISLEGILISVNQCAVEMLGYAEPEMVGMSMLQLVAPEEQDESSVKLAELLAGNPQPMYERTFIKKDGTRVFTELNVAVVYDSTGKPTHIQSLARNITDRKQDEEKINRRLNELTTVNAVSQVVASQLELQSMIELTGERLRQIPNVDCLFIALLDSNTQMISFPYYRFYEETIPSSPIPLGKGLTSRVIENRKPLVINQDTDQQSDKLGAVRHNAPGKKHQPAKSWMGIPMQVGDQVIGVLGVQNFQQANAYTADDVRLWETIAANVGIAIQNAQLYAAAQQELTERRKLIDELVARNAELQGFNYTVSHDLKTPLVTIKGFLGYLLEDIRKGNVERLQKDSQRIANAVDKMNDLLDDLLALTRVGRLVNPPQQIDTEQLIREAVEIVRVRLEARGVIIRIHPNLPPMYGDKPRLLEVWQNLLDNAAKYMGDQPEPVIEIGCRAQDGKSVFFVRDNGIGIDPRFHDQVFGLFNKLDARVEGTGVGLALVKRIIEVNGGRIWVESELGKGAAFCFTLGGRDS